MYCSLLSHCSVKSQRTSCLRGLSTLIGPHQSLEVQNSVYISQSADPFFNITFEDWLFRHSPPDKPLLFVYRNSPCVVIGRNQNPWKEVNMTALRSSGVPLIRRRSGGGTVYHDLGNTNFSIHLSRRTFDRRATSQIVLRAVRSLGIEHASVNDRNDICVGDDKMSHRRTVDLAHVSGSAYKLVSARAYHHGTMLISTRLDTLGDLLRTDKETMVTAGVASVRSPVCNLQQFNHRVEHSVFTSAVVDEFRKEYHLGEPTDPTQYIDETPRELPYIEKGIIELQSWDWLFGQTPQFTYTIEKIFPWGSAIAEVRAKHGVILSCALRAPEAALSPVDRADLKQLETSFEGKMYGSWPQPNRDSPGIVVADVENWLAEMLR
ncbi:hypothetical protein GGX14DRAFT_486508 [Mycena pura]|uniref:Putative lipoate-protein ligase A n=1 Tax=Mycena pura TaxID=153505 RepID=A0AAD6YS74_9AGAR|nr:hypothetical protein GGX14DRAFT_486508 [Mycena pura]